MPWGEEHGWVFSHLAIGIGPLGFSRWVGGLGAVTAAAVAGLTALYPHHQRDLQGRIDAGALLSWRQGVCVPSFVLGGLWTWARHE